MVVIEAMECMRDGLESVLEDLCGKGSIPLIKAITHPVRQLPDTPPRRSGFLFVQLFRGEYRKFPLRKGGIKRGM